MIDPVRGEPKPDFSEFVRILKREEAPGRVPLVEIGLDHEILQLICERFLKRPYCAYGKETRKEFFSQQAEIYFRLGYDYLPTWPEWDHHPPSKTRETKDTGLQAKGTRIWVEEAKGLISSWEEFERFPWEKIRFSLGAYELTAACLKKGMKLTVGCTLYEHILERLLGYEGLFYLLKDDEELVSRIFEQWGRKVYEFYEAVIGREEVGAIFHADDLGFKTSTMISPADLRKHLFPWFKKYAALAHQAGKVFFYHCCGNIYGEVMEDLIEEVKIDAFHSFEDEIMPVTAFKARYGSRVAALGGVDMDKLSRSDEAGLRAYVREILVKCMPKGGFALGAGNSVANYVPLENYCIMLDEARRWRP